MYRDWKCLLWALQVSNKRGHCKREKKSVHSKLQIKSTITKKTKLKTKLIKRTSAMLSLKKKSHPSPAFYKIQWQIWTLLEAEHLWIFPALQHLDIRLFPVARGSAACPPTRPKKIAFWSKLDICGWLSLWGKNKTKQKMFGRWHLLQKQTVGCCTTVIPLIY